MIGVRIRELRQARKMTVKELAAAADVSTGLVSQVERGLTDPSLETLRRLARALGLPLFDLFRQEEQEAVAVVRRDRRMLVRSPHSGIAYSRVSPGRGHLEVLEGVLEPGGASAADAWSHPSEESLKFFSRSEMRCRWRTPPSASVPSSPRSPTRCTWRAAARVPRPPG